MQLVRLVLSGLFLMVLAFAISQGLTRVRFEFALGVAFVIAVFIFVFIRTDAGLYLVLFSMLLSPEFAVGGGGLAESRTVVLRLEDLLLIAIAFSWFAKMAVNKEMGLVVKTPLNRWILLYGLTTLVATLVGYLAGTVKTTAGFFYVLKYVEYFVVYYLTINNLRDRAHAWRLVGVAFVTAAVVSLIGMAQIPSGQRVSAPFEGEVGEPNTLGGYLLFMMAIGAGVALESSHFTVRARMAALVGLMMVPFLFTLSRASYVGLIPMIAALAFLSTRRKFMMGVLALAILAAPLALPSVLPKSVVKRILYTFEPEQGQATVRLGPIAFDPSTSERVIAFRNALEGWAKRPILGYGVTGFRFMDAQYARALVETGFVGLFAFCALLWMLLKSGLGSFRSLRDGDERGLALGFVAGTVGLLFHAIGSNTFIIVRIMEPFWFFAGVVMALPTLSSEGGSAPLPIPPPGIAAAKPPLDMPRLRVPGPV
ncbi:MAG: O-antigen ligase family protein [Candidatus Rokubacteria bacterium]|nr:O-antigen ligase family protein [Candidatus Rokubacteria bacterium]MBI4594657.1 O-antigen ligase family protein [Candidatus Rokubacteria bacterium]